MSHIIMNDPIIRSNRYLKWNYLDNFLKIFECWNLNLLLKFTNVCVFHKFIIDKFSSQKYVIHKFAVHKTIIVHYYNFYWNIVYWATRIVLYIYWNSLMCTYADHVGPHLQSTENELLCLSKILYQDFSPYLIQYSHTHTHTHTHTRVPLIRL